MSTCCKSVLALAFLLGGPPVTLAAQSADPTTTRQEFITAMQRVRMHQPDLADSPDLEAYAIHDYLIAARLRRDLLLGTNDTLDSSIDEFLRSHAGQPVGRGLRHDWLVSLAQRRRWDWFLARSTDVADPALICDKLQARLTVGDTQGLAAAA